MRLGAVEGIVARRVLLNFWADPEAARHLLPRPLEVLIQNGLAVVGVCLIRLERMRPKGFPVSVRMSSENMAHRIAVRYPSPEGMKEGVFIWRRDTDAGLVTALGPRLFPGVHRRSQFQIAELDRRLAFHVRTDEYEADVSFEATCSEDWSATRLFPTSAEVRRFFERDDGGFSYSLRQEKLEGIPLRSMQWEMSPLQVVQARAAFFDNPERFPAGSVGFDGAVLMRGIPSEWHELEEVPELAGLECGS